MPMDRLTRWHATGVTSTIAPTSAPLAGVRAVSYDLWQTLLVDVDPGDVWTRRTSALSELLGTSYDVANGHLLEAYASLGNAWDRGRAVTVPTVAEQILRAAGRNGDPAGAVRALEQVTQATTVRLLPEVMETLEALERAGHPVALVADTGMTSGRYLRLLLRELGILDAFSVLVFSDEIGTPTPGARPFQTAIETLGVTGAETVHVGDLRRRDVAGAVGAGLRAVRYRGAYDDVEPGPADAPYVIDRHSELLGLLGID